MASVILIGAAIPRLAAGDLESILAAKLLRVGLTTADTPPLVVTNASGVPGGFEGDFIAEVAHRMDVKLTFVRSAQTADELIRQVAAGQVDVGIGQLTDSLEWAKSVRFCRPYMQLQEFRLVDRLAATRSGGASRLLADNNSRITSVADSIVVPSAREEFGERLTVLPTLQAAVEAVLAGRAVAALADDVTVSRWLGANPGAGLRLEVVPRRDHHPGLAMAVNWKAADLQAWLDLCVEKCGLDGTLQSLAAKHLGGSHAPAAK